LPWRPPRIDQWASRLGLRSANDLATIREWARAKGYQVADRGRISANIMDEYDASD
jgi:hypothetical protein